MTKFNEMQMVKRRFFAMRNGAIADNMRRHGANYRIIFGLNLPQIIEIATETQKSVELAETLWKNQTTRESMLMAPMIYPQEEMTFDVACRWISEVPTPEVADILCHRLLRHKEYAWQLSQTKIKSSSAMERYVALRLMFNLLPNYIDEIDKFVHYELLKNEPMNGLLCRQLIDEIEFLREEN